MGTSEDTSSPRTLRRPLLDGPMVFHYQPPCEAMERDDLEQWMDVLEKKVGRVKREISALWSFITSFLPMSLRTVLDAHLLFAGFDGYSMRNEFIEQNIDDFVSELGLSCSDVHSLFSYHSVAAAQQTTSIEAAKAIQRTTTLTEYYRGQARFREIAG